jgi:hypothetical protein
LRVEGVGCRVEGRGSEVREREEAMLVSTKQMERGGKEEEAAIQSKSHANICDECFGFWQKFLGQKKPKRN